MLTEFDLEKLEEKQRRLTEEIEDAKKLIEDQKSKPRNYQFAFKLHDMFCCTNHTDGCSWYYEIKNNRHDWSGYAHKRYLDSANELMKFLEK